MPADQHQVAAAGKRGDLSSVVGQLIRARRRRQLDPRAVHLEVVEVVRVEREDRLRPVRLSEVLDRAGRRVARVVPAAERRHDHRVDQVTQSGVRGSRPCHALTVVAARPPDRSASGPHRDRYARAAQLSSAGACRIFDSVLSQRVVDRATGRWARCCRRRPDPGRLRRARGLQRDPQRHPAGVVRAIHDAYFEAVWTRRDQHLRRQLGALGEYGIADRICELVRGRRADRPGGRPMPQHARSPALRARQRRARAPSCRRSATSPSPRCGTPTRSRSRACSTAASTRCWSRPARTCCRPRPRSLGAKRAHGRTPGATCRDRPRDGGDHRHHAAGHRDRRRADRAGAARHRPDRAQLRHRARPR